MAIEVGQNVVVRGKAIGRVEAVTAEAFVVVELGLKPGEESRFEVPRGSDALRPAVDAAEANRLIAVALAATPDARDVDDRSIAYRRVSKSGDLDAQLRTLVGIYRHAAPAYPERQYADILEKVACAELALALGKSIKQIRARLRQEGKGAPVPASVQLPDRAHEVAAAELPAIVGYAPLGAFALDGELAIGEGRPELTLRARHGIWLAYVAGDMDAPDFRLVAVHRDHVDAIGKRRAACGEVTAEGAKIAMFDATLADDDDLADEVFAGDGTVNPRCVALSIGGDGRFPVDVLRVGGQVVCACVILAASDDE